jgi:hypothetical protein
VGKGLKERNVEGRFRCIRVVLLAEDKDEGRNWIRSAADVYSFLNSSQGTFRELQEVRCRAARALLGLVGEGDPAALGMLSTLQKRQQI